MTSGFDDLPVNRTVASLPVATPLERQPLRPWGFWATIGLSIAVFAVFVALQTVVVVGFLAARWRGGPIDVQAAADLESNGLCVSLCTLISEPCCVAMIALFAWLRRGYRVKEYLRLDVPSGRVVCKWLLMLASFIVCSDALTYLLGRDVVPEFMTNTYETADFASLLFFALIVVAPIFEEVFFRGFLFVGIRHSVLGATGAVLLTSLAWAGIHQQYDMYQISTVFAYGILLGIARLKTVSTSVPIVMHAFMNVIATGELLVKVHLLS
ncbi:MAG: CPBP family intramembrane metalloprotease [Phycisphaerae bacterium]|nr:CPBP family intramembrane metalloprotease [Phycisphaerae bacterium]